MRLTLEQALINHQSSVFKAAFHVCRNPQDAEDVAQDTFLAYYSSSDQFESEDHIRAWLLKVAVNKAKNLKTSFWQRNRVSLPDLTAWLESHAPARMKTLDPDSEEVLAAVMGLPDKCRIIVHLFYYEDYSVKEIAEVLEIKENTVKSQLHRGRTLLRSMLKEKWENE